MLEGRSNSFSVGQKHQQHQEQQPSLVRSSFPRHGRRANTASAANAFDAPCLPAANLNVQPATRSSNQSATSSKHWGTELSAEGSGRLGVGGLDATSAIRQPPHSSGTLGQVDIHAIVTSCISEATQSLKRCSNSNLSRSSSHKHAQVQGPASDSGAHETEGPSRTNSFAQPRAGHYSSSEGIAGNGVELYARDSQQQQPEQQQEQLQQQAVMYSGASDTEHSYGEEQSEGESETGSEACTSTSSILDPNAVYTLIDASEAAKKNRWGSSNSHYDEGEGVSDENDVTHPSTLNPFFSLSPEALAEEARANKATMDRQQQEQQVQAQQEEQQWALEQGQVQAQQEEQQQELRDEQVQAEQEEQQRELKDEQVQTQPEEQQRELRDEQVQTQQEAAAGASRRVASPCSPHANATKCTNPQRGSPARQSLERALSAVLNPGVEAGTPSHQEQQQKDTSGRRSSRRAPQPGTPLADALQQLLLEGSVDAPADLPVQQPSSGAQAPEPRLGVESSFVLEGSPSKEGQRQQQQASSSTQGVSPEESGGGHLSAGLSDCRESIPQGTRQPIGHRSSHVGEISIKGLAVSPAWGQEMEGSPEQSVAHPHLNKITAVGHGERVEEGGGALAAQPSTQQGGVVREILAGLSECPVSNSSASSSISSTAAVHACSSHEKNLAAAQTAAMGPLRGRGSARSSNASSSHAPKKRVAEEEAVPHQGPKVSLARTPDVGVDGSVQKGGLPTMPPTISTVDALKAKAAAYLMRFQAEQALQGFTVAKDGRKESNLKPGELGAEYAWAMSAEVHEAKRSPRVSAEDLGAEFSWAMGAELGGAAAPPPPLGLPGAIKAAAKLRPAALSTLPPSKRKAEEPPLPPSVVEGMDGGHLGHGLATPGAAVTAAAAALHARQGAAPARDASPLGAGKWADGPMQLLLEEFGQLPSSPGKDHSNNTRTPQQRQLSAAREEGGRDDPDSYSKVMRTLKLAAEDTLHTQATRGQDPDRPLPPRPNATAAAAAALGIRPADSSGTQASKSPPSSSSTRTPTAAATAAALTPNRHPGTPSVSRPVNTTASIAAMLSPPAHSPQSLSLPQHSRPGSSLYYDLPSPGSMTTLPNSHTTYAAGAPCQLAPECVMLHPIKPDWTAPHHKASPGQTFYIPGTYPAGPIYVPTAPVAVLPYSPTLSPTPALPSPAQKHAAAAAQQRQPEADVALVLQQLQFLGYRVPEHAAQVLRLILDDANGGSISSGGALKDPQGVAQQLWGTGGEPPSMDRPEPQHQGDAQQPQQYHDAPSAHSNGGEASSSSWDDLLKRTDSVTSSARQSFNGWVHPPPARPSQTGVQVRPSQQQVAPQDGGALDPPGSGSAGLAAWALTRQQQQSVADSGTMGSSMGQPREGSKLAHLAQCVTAAHNVAEEHHCLPLRNGDDAKPQSLLHERRQKAAADRERIAKAEAAQRRAPCAPRKRTPSGQLPAHPLQRPGQPKTPPRLARDSGPGAVGDYYHDTRGGKITMSGPSAMVAWRTASSIAPATQHTIPVTPGGYTGHRGRPPSPQRAQPSPQRGTQASPSHARPASPGGAKQGQLPGAGGSGSILDSAENGQQVVLLRPPKWQERDTRQWLSSLSLDLLPEEEAAPMLENPLRNGVLLCDVAAAVTGTPLPLATSEPHDQQAARSNILLALDHLGLLDLFDESQLVKMTAVSPEKAKALVKSRHVNSYARGYALKLKEQQLKVGMSLMVEVEKVLQGNQDATWGLLNHLRHICTGELPTRGASRNSSRGASPARPSSAQGRPQSPRHSRSSSSVHVCTPRHNAHTAAPSSPPPGPVLLRGPGSFASPQRSSRPASPSVRSSNAGTPQRMIHGSRPSSPAASRRPSSPSTSRRGGQGQWPMVPKGGNSRWELPEEEIGPTMIMASGVGPGQFVIGPRPVSPSRRQEILMGLEKRQQQAEAEARQAAAVAAARAAQEEEQQKRAWEVEQLKLEAIMGQAGGDSGQGPSLLGLPGTFQAPARPHKSLTAWELLARPSYNRPTLPYTSSEIASLEASVIRWLVEMGALNRNVAAQGFQSLLGGLSDGLFLPWLVQHITGTSIVGINKKPVNEAARHANMLKTIHHLRTLPNMSRRFLNFEEALLHCEHGATLGLLEDLHRVADHQPPAGTSLVQDIPPYLPYATSAQSRSTTPTTSRPTSAPAYPQAQPPPQLHLHQLQQQQHLEQLQQQQWRLQQRLRASSPTPSIPLRPPSPSPSKRPSSSQPGLRPLLQQQQQFQQQHQVHMGHVCGSNSGPTAPSTPKSKFPFPFQAPSAPATPELYLHNQPAPYPGPHPQMMHCKTPNSPIVTASTPWTDPATLSNPPSTTQLQTGWTAGTHNTAPLTQSPAPVLHQPHRASNASGAPAQAAVGAPPPSTPPNIAAAPPHNTLQYQQRPASAGRSSTAARTPERGATGNPASYPSHLSMSITPTPSAPFQTNIAKPTQYRSPSQHRPASRSRLQQIGTSSLDAYLLQQHQQQQQQLGTPA